MNSLGIDLKGKVIRITDTAMPAYLVRVISGFGASPHTAGKALYVEDADGKTFDARYRVYELATDEQIEAFEQEVRHRPVRRVKVIEDRIAKLQDEIGNLQVELAEQRRQAHDIIARDAVTTEAAQI